MGKLNWGNTVCALLLLCAATAIASPAQTFTTLYSFTGYPTGNFPLAALVQGTNGDLCGTTFQGGDSGLGGTVFNITTTGTLTPLYSFYNAYPTAGLIQAIHENFYSTTPGGGAYANGTVFKITPSGTLSTLHNFCRQGYGNCTDGAAPQEGLVQATNGNFYGTTESGGASGNGCGGFGCGTVFKITLSGKLITLYSFGGTDGANPTAALVQDTNGNFYGTTYEGGANDSCFSGGGCGTVFKITPRGTLTTLYSFFCSQGNCSDGANPYAGLTQATDGNFYGTTPYAYGGINGYGTVFKINPRGTLTTLYSFCSQGGGRNCTDGATPFSALIQATDGDFYGTTSGGGVNDSCLNWGGCGTVFKITPRGTLTTQYRFCSQGGSNCTNGANPVAALTQDTSGNLYGTTASGGSDDCPTRFSHRLVPCGTVFSLSVGLGPFVETNPTSGKVGAAVKILGTNLTGATRVRFNGTAAKFTVVSKSEIKTTVPEGASTGEVKVKTPRGTLKSNVVFSSREPILLRCILTPRKGHRSIDPMP